MDINEQAPVIAKDEIEIEANPETVWRVIVDINRWPEWNPDVTSAKINGDLRQGTTFRWKAGPGTITSTLQDVQSPARISWTGKTFGIKAVHVWELEPSATGTLVKGAESWEGFPTRLLPGTMRKMLQKAISEGLLHLKTEAERQTST